MTDTSFKKIWDNKFLKITLRICYGFGNTCRIHGSEHPFCFIGFCILPLCTGCYTLLYRFGIYKRVYNYDPVAAFLI